MRVMLAYSVSSLLDVSLQLPTIHSQSFEDRPRAARTLHLVINKKDQPERYICSKETGLE